MLNKTKIDYNHFEYARFLKLENNLFQALIQLKEVSVKTIGKEPDNLISFLDNPLTYLVNEFYALNKDIIPKTTPKEIAFKNNSIVTPGQINSLASEFNNLKKELRNHAPTITKTDVVSGLNKEFFNIYLDDNKKQHYKALKQLIKSLDVLRDYENIQNAHIIRGTQSLSFNGLDLKIQTNKFI